MRIDLLLLGLVVIMALGLVDIRIALFSILRREKYIMATEQELLTILDGIGSDVETISGEFTDFTNQIAALQGQLATAGHATDISSDLMDRATAIKAKLDALASSVVAPVPTTDGGDTLGGATDNDVTDTTGAGDGADTLGGAQTDATGDNGPPPGG